MPERGFFIQEKVDELYPNALMIQPMGIWQIPNKKKNMTEDILEEKQNEYFAQVKKDGNWYAISITEDNVYLFSRTISKKTGLLVEKGGNIPHLTQEFQKLPAGTYIEGEIYFPQGNSDLVGTIMRCKEEKAVQRQKEDGYIHYYIHNIVYYDGKSLMQETNLERYYKVKKIYEEYFFNSEFIHLADIYMPEDYNFFKLAEEYIANGEEGLVLKKKNGLYYPDTKKAWETIKLKREDRLDVISLGFEEPTKFYEGDALETWNYWIRAEDEMRMQGNYYNQKGYIPVTKNYYNQWIGAIVIGVYGEQGELINLGTVSSGLTDELKISIKNNPDNYLMQPILIECMEVYHGTSIRSPRLICFRDDINISDCTIDKLM